MTGHQTAAEKIYRPTTDASGTYQVRAPNDVARSYSAAEDGNLSSMTKNNTLVISEVVPTIVYVPRVEVHVAQIGETTEFDFGPR